MNLIQNTENEENNIDKNYNIGYSITEKAEGRNKMSNIIVYNSGNYALIGSDSRNMKGDIVDSDEYQKLFPIFEFNAIIGFYGVTTFLGENKYREEVGEILKQCLKSAKYLGDVENELISELSYRNLGNGTGIVILYTTMKGVQLKHIYLTPQDAVIKVHTSINSGYTYGTFYINDFKSSTISSPNTLKKMITTNMDADAFVHNPSVIGGKVQLYEISLQGIKNLSEPPFDVLKTNTFLETI